VTLYYYGKTCVIVTGWLKATYLLTYLLTYINILVTTKMRGRLSTWLELTVFLFQPSSSNWQHAKLTIVFMCHSTNDFSEFWT